MTHRLCISPVNINGEAEPLEMRDHALPGTMESQPLLPLGRGI